jgi:hypothetical protein
MKRGQSALVVTPAITVDVEKEPAPWGGERFGDVEIITASLWREMSETDFIRGLYGPGYIRMSDTWRGSMELRFGSRDSAESFHKFMREYFQRRM